MSMLLNEEQRLLRESAREFLSGQGAGERACASLRDSRDPLGYDPALWREVVAMGWTAAVFPEAEGGLDFGFKGLGAVFEQAGRTLAVMPLLSSVVLGGGLVLGAGNAGQRAPDCRHHQRRSAAGAGAGRRGPARAAPRCARAARREAGGWVLDGEKWLVLDGHVATLLVVVARSAGRAGRQPWPEPVPGRPERGRRRGAAQPDGRQPECGAGPFVGRAGGRQRVARASPAKASRRSTRCSTAPASAWPPRRSA